MPNTMKTSDNPDALLQKFSKTVFAISKSTTPQYGVSVMFRGVVDSTPYLFERTKTIDGAAQKVPACSIKLTTPQKCLGIEHQNKQFRRQPSISVIFQNAAYEDAIKLRVGDVIDVICKAADKYNESKKAFYTEFLCGHTLTVAYTIEGYVDVSVRSLELKKMYVNRTKSSSSPAVSTTNRRKVQFEEPMDEEEILF